MFKYTDKGTVPINIPYCKVCGKQMGYREELPESEGDINVAFASFGSQSNENKASILKDRYKKGLEKDGITQKFVKYDEDEAVKTLQAFAKLIKDYRGTFQSLDVANIASGFAGGKCGAGIDGSWDTASNQKALGDNFGAAKLPTINVNGTDKQLISMFGYKYIGVNGSSKFPATAQILAHYLAGEECQLQRTEKLGWGPSNKKVQENKAVTGSAVLKAIGEQAKNACIQVNVANTFWDPMANLGNKIIADTCNPSDAAAMKKLLNETISNVRDEG